MNESVFVEKDQSQATFNEKVWVAFASTEQQFHIALPFQIGMTIEDAITQSKIAEQTQLPENMTVGIFGHKVDDIKHQLQAGDRVEIYRALTINPKEKRRKRAAENPVGLYCRGNRFKLSK